MIALLVYSVLMESEKLKIYQNRLLVADLINDVLCGKKTVQQALSCFPDEKNDINIKCAFDALMYREADEDLRSKIRDYANTQDDFLAEIADILKENQKLPANIIQRYLKYNQDDFIPDKENNWKNIFKKIKRMINF